MNRKSVLFVCLDLLLLISCANAQSATSDMPIVKAMTFNIRVDSSFGWALRCEKVYQVMRNQNADIIGIQEGSHHQVAEIREAMTDYTHYSPGKDSGRAGESCSIYYKTDRFDLNDSGTFWFSDTPDEPSRGWDSWGPRVCSWVYLTDKKTGTSFYVFNCHLAAFFAQGARQKEAELLAQRIASRKTNDPVILLGDFNMNVGNKAMDYLLNADGKTAYPKMTDAWHDLHDTKGPTYDHIILNKDAKAIEINVDNSKVSDHDAIVAQIQLIAPEKAPIAAEQKNVDEVSVN
jgi:endonuclease/exonuclease/phosphatase family metal-dependent hydrolase